jgi:hypothetical protein
MEMAGGSHVVLPYVDDVMHEVWQGAMDDNNNPPGTS